MDPQSRTDEQRFQQMLSLFIYLIVHTSGDVQEALDWLRQYSTNPAGRAARADKKHMSDIDDKYEFASVMGFVLDGLHQNSKIAKDEVDHITSYKDMLGSIFSGPGRGFEED